MLLPVVFLDAVVFLVLIIYTLKHAIRLPLNRLPLYPSKLESNKAYLLHRNPLLIANKNYLKVCKYKNSSYTQCLKQQFEDSSSQ